MPFLGNKLLPEGVSTSFIVAALGLFVCLAAVFCNRVMLRLFQHTNLLDRPDGGLKNHQAPVPFSGGLATLVAVFLGHCLSHFLLEASYKLLAVLLPFFLLGLLDDLFCISQKVKFIVQLALLLGALHVLQLKINMLEIVWMLAVINAFNLIDVADGLCATVAACSALGFSAVALFCGSPALSGFFLSVGGAAVGFLTVNLPPARAYLGDSGSTFFGAAFALAPSLLPWPGFFSKTLVSSTLLGMPLAEVFMLVLIRSYLGIAPYKGSPHHFYSFLKSKGWALRKILFFVALIGCGLILLALGFLLGLCHPTFFFALTIFAFLLWLLVVYF